jgi:S-adenosylmethionine:tRNA ribosyltransferase-isomerase
MNGFDLSDYDFHLPESRIAQFGLEPRDTSKLLVGKKRKLEFEHKIFRDITDYLVAGDVLILNRTRVIPARLEAKKPSGGKLEVLLLRELEYCVWSAYLKPAKRVQVGGIVDFGPLQATVLEVLEDGARVLKFNADIRVHLATLGALPIPPYIQNPNIGERYQTVYGSEPGSVAAPTAGLHFTQDLLEKLNSMGVEIMPVTLHVGAGTFKPVNSSIEDHVMHFEVFEIPSETALAVTRAKLERRRVIAVGTTSVRTLESAWVDGANGGMLEPGEGETNIFIRPPYQFKVVDALITNFHLPKSTLLMLVAAFAGFETMTRAYKVALEHDYRFYSLGDAMLIQ